ncbi:hypothetical protein JTB14_032378 [Gonioctena quinquepunctata]|nr:hypothetical protein JTB14_032378 [Gonioctena quinquepunctata]
MFQDFGEKLLPLSKQWHDKCIFITGITTASIETMRIGNFGDDDAAKRYILCLWLVSDVMTVKNKRLTLRKELLKDLVPVKMVNGFQIFINCTIEANKSDIPHVLKRLRRSLTKKNIGMEKGYEAFIMDLD